jgi:hypothetical protein
MQLAPTPAPLNLNASRSNAARPLKRIAPQFGILPLGMPLPGSGQAVDFAAKGLLPRLSNGLRNSGQRMWDSLILLTAANIVPVVGHLTLWPLAGASAALGVKDFLKGAHLGGKFATNMASKYPKASTIIKSLEGPFNKAAAGGYRWVDKALPAIYGGLGVFLAGLVIHPLLLIGGPMLLIHPLAYSGGFVKNFAQEAIKLAGKVAK